MNGSGIVAQIGGSYGDDFQSRQVTLARTRHTGAHTSDPTHNNSDDIFTTAEAVQLDARCGGDRCGASNVTAGGSRHCRAQR